MRMLLVENDLADIELTQNGVKCSQANIELDWVMDGESALAYWLREAEYQRKRLAQAILLNLNLPDLHGFGILESIKNNVIERFISVIIFTTLDANFDVQQAYALGANCVIQKPSNLSQYINTLTSISTYWTNLVKLLHEI